MTIAAAISSDLRARANFMAYCPLCSVIGVLDTPDSLIGPHLRDFTFQADKLASTPCTVVKIVWCCSLSDPFENCFESESEAAAWWREKRQQPIKDIATDNRRRNVLRKLAAANLEPIV